MQALTVAELNEYVRRSLAADPMLRGLKIRGEISNFKRHSTGHLYFTLKDDQARIACVMFRSAAMSLRVQPRDGLRVVLSGSVSLYTATGQYQFYVDSMQSDGVGALYEAFEKLKASLQAEGLFDPAIKKQLPLLPRIVGIVTSPTGAVIHDICQVAGRRNPGVQLLLCPAQVQGEGAAEQIAQGIRRLDAIPEVDVIIVGRGGGSLEELWAFNEETVARAIFACKTPVVSAVGHETDFTIADFAADVRAATPSAAAEMTVPRREDLLAELENLMQRANTAQKRIMDRMKTRLQTLSLRLENQHPGKQLQYRMQRLSGLKLRMDKACNTLLALKNHRLSALKGRLLALSPLEVLQRGYAMISDRNGKVIASADGVQAGEKIHITLRDGGFSAQVTEGESKHGGQEKSGI